jgi:hypothetical protein
MGLDLANLLLKKKKKKQDLANLLADQQHFIKGLEYYY